MPNLAWEEDDDGDGITSAIDGMAEGGEGKAKREIQSVQHVTVGALPRLLLCKSSSCCCGGVDTPMSLRVPPSPLCVCLRTVTPNPSHCNALFNPTGRHKLEAVVGQITPTRSTVTSRYC